MISFNWCRLAPSAIHLLLVGLLSGMLAGCGSRPTPVPPPSEPPRVGPLTRNVEADPDLRVRIVNGANEIRIDSPNHVRVGSPGADQEKATRVFNTPLVVRHNDQGFVLESVGGGIWRWRLDQLELHPVGAGTLKIGQRSVPGFVQLHGRRTAGNRALERLDAVNHVKLEAYLPGVVAAELYPKWNDETFAAQAIAARSYALWERHIHRHRHYDLEATTASQAYAGTTTNRRVTRAVRRTRGEVVTFADRVLPTFYSSACGGTGQDAAAVIPAAPDLPPLRGRPHGPFCQKSEWYRWGPIVRNRQTLTQRLVAWGREKDHSLQHLRGIERIDVVRENNVGRPTRIRVTDTNKRRHVINAEWFRFACNYPTRTLPAPSREQNIRSSHVTIRTGDQRVVFHDGRGFGHGAGLCQWGAEGLAKRGYGYRRILLYYYPEAELLKLY
ncbi:MAG: SpoIID/LytB domain-containing protein [Phycisphaeraceae bacterium]|nr:SpoIID/LytB domain-containing protein [Phycisphaeraceae bacterium]